jgi:hypothetical protein
MFSRTRGRETHTFLDPYILADMFSRTRVRRDSSTAKCCGARHQSLSASLPLCLYILRNACLSPPPTFTHIHSHAPLPQCVSLGSLAPFVCASLTRTSDMPATLDLYIISSTATPRSVHLQRLAFGVCDLAIESRRYICARASTQSVRGREREEGGVARERGRLVGGRGEGGSARARAGGLLTRGLEREEEEFLGIRMVEVCWSGGPIMLLSSSAIGSQTWRGSIRRGSSWRVRRRASGG